MKKEEKKRTARLIGTVMLLLVLFSTSLMAQVVDPWGPMPFRQEELDQMLAPIALYPDDLLSQVLMAATYPLEVVQAARWVQANPNLQGDQLAFALEGMNWDPSVKALVNFPYVLQMMNDRLDWMGRLGDAFLAQPEQIMSTVQMLRQRARAQGSLMTTNEQRVFVDPHSQAIMIEPLMPQVIYVPIYDPLIVFGPWWWPAYPPYYYHPTGVVIRSGFVGFGPRIILAIPWGYAWGSCDWRTHRIVVDVLRNMNFNNRIDRPRYAPTVAAGKMGQGIWNHDPNHRRGMAYRTPEIAQKFGRGPLPGAENRRVFRGYEGPQPTGRPSPVTHRPETLPPRVTPALGPTRPEGHIQPPAPGSNSQRGSTANERTLPITPRPETTPPRVTPAPSPTRPEGHIQPPAPGPNSQRGSAANERTLPVTPRPETLPPRVTPAPGPTRPEGHIQPPAPVQNPQVTSVPKVTRPEPPKPSSPSGPLPRVAPSSPAPAQPNPTAFSQVGPIHQTRQNSTRGHESLGGNRPPTPGPSGDNRPSSGGGPPGSGPSRPQGK
jgi:hypothetical protein